LDRGLAAQEVGNQTRKLKLQGSPNINLKKLSSISCIYIIYIACLFVCLYPLKVKAYLYNYMFFDPHPGDQNCHKKKQPKTTLLN